MLTNKLGVLLDELLEALLLEVLLQGEGRGMEGGR